MKSEELSFSYGIFLLFRVTFLFLLGVKRTVQFSKAGLISKRAAQLIDQVVN